MDDFEKYKKEFEANKKEYNYATPYTREHYEFFLEQKRAEGEQATKPSKLKLFLGWAFQ